MSVCVFVCLFFHAIAKNPSSRGQTKFCSKVLALIRASDYTIFLCLLIQWRDVQVFFSFFYTFTRLVVMPIQSSHWTVLGFWCLKVISVHVWHVYFYFSGHGTCLFSHDSWIMIYTTNDFYSEVCLFKSTRFDSVSQTCTMVDVHRSSANSYVW